MNIIEFIMNLDWKKLVESVLSALLVSGIIGGFGYLITKKNYERLTHCKRNEIVWF